MVKVKYVERRKCNQTRAECLLTSLSGATVVNYKTLSLSNKFSHPFISSLPEFDSMRNNSQQRFHSVGTAPPLAHNTQRAFIYSVLFHILQECLAEGHAFTNCSKEELLFALILNVPPYVHRIRSIGEILQIRLR